MFTWALLIAAILTEVAATIALKTSDGFTRLIPSAIVVVGYLMSFWLLGILLTRGMSIGVVYALWSAIGLSLIVIADILWFGERLTSIQTAGLFAIVIGVVALEMGGAAG